MSMRTDSGLMEPSEFWVERLAEKQRILETNPDAIERFRRNHLGMDIDDVANAIVRFPGREQRGEATARNATRQAWNVLGKHIDADLVQLVEEKPAGRPVTAKAGGHRATTSSIEFAYLATRLRPWLGDHTLEIGAGYGGLARALLETKSHDYTIVDYGVVQQIQQYYLGDDDRVNYLDPGDELPYANLYINTRSMFEMTLEQIEWYGEQMKGQAHFFSMNRSKFHDMDEWPLPQNWELVYDEPHPMRSAFRMRLWFIP